MKVLTKVAVALVGIGLISTNALGQEFGGSCINQITGSYNNTGVEISKTFESSRFVSRGETVDSVRYEVPVGTLANESLWRAVLINPNNYTAIDGLLHDRYPSGNSEFTIPLTATIADYGNRMYLSIGVYLKDVVGSLGGVTGFLTQYELDASKFEHQQKCFADAEHVDALSHAVQFLLSK